MRRVEASLSLATMVDVPPPFIPGAFVGAAHHYRLRVYFEDTDLSGIVYHANYLRYMERARSDMLRIAGIDQRAAMEAGWRRGRPSGDRKAAVTRPLVNSS